MVTNIFIMKRLIFISVFMGYFLISGAQNDFSPELQLEGGQGLNLSYFDVGGGGLGFSFSAGANYRWARNWMAGLHLMIGQAYGTDDGSKNDIRNYAYSSTLLGVVTKATFLIPVKDVVRIDKPSPFTRRGPIFSPYLYAGPGLLYSNPVPKKDLVNDIHEGFSKIAVLFTGGFGAVYNIDNNWSVGVEAGFNFTTSDYLDGFTYKTSAHNDMYHTALVMVVYRIHDFSFSRSNSEVLTSFYIQGDFVK